MKILTLTHPHLTTHHRKLLLYLTLTLLTTAITLLTPYILGDFLDTLIAGTDITSVLVFCAIFGGLNILRILIGYITAALYIRMQTKMGYDLNMTAIRHIQNLSLSYNHETYVRAHPCRDLTARYIVRL